MMVPTAKRKMQSFIQKHESASINPHAPGSPPLQNLNNTGVPVASPVIPVLDRQVLGDGANFAPHVSRPSGLGDNARISLAPPRANDLIEKQRDDGPDTGHAWEALKDEPHAADGLRERWEEQSSINSLFSESEPARPASVQYSAHKREYDDDDTRSDIVDNRQPPRRGRNAHRKSEVTPVFEYQNGQLVVPSLKERGFSSSMITHAPNNPRADASRFRQNPFGSTSDESSPRPQRDPRFLRSNFPVPGTETKRPRRLEQSPPVMEPSRRISPTKPSSAPDAPKPGAYFQPPKELSQAPQRATDFHNGRNPALDWDSDDSDIHSQGDEFPDQEQEHTPKAVRKRPVVDDTTMILNPPKPVIAPKSHKTVTLQDDALLGSPIRQALLEPMFSPPKKRVRDIDYDEEALRQMNFAELRNEPFDHDPTRQVIRSPAKPPADNLDDRLEFYRSKDEDAQAQLFTQMSVREWDESGDWFLERFSSIVTRMKEARQARRKVVEQYEKEVSEREEEVRRSKEAIDRKLSKLKHDSSAMLKGSEPSD